MSTPDKGSFENAIRNKVLDHETTYSEEGWTKMKQMIESERRPFSLFRINRFTKLLYPAILLLMVLSFAGYKIFHHTNKSINGISSVEKNNLPFKKEPDAKQHATGKAAFLANNNEHFLKTDNPLSSENKKKIPITANSDYSIKKQQNDASKADETNSNDASKESNPIENSTHRSNLSQSSDAKNNLTIKDKSQALLSSSTSASTDTLTMFGDKKVIKKTVKKIKTGDISDAKNKADGKNRPISFGLFAGFGFFMQTYKSGYSYGTDGPSNVGVFINYPVSDRFTLQSGLTVCDISKALYKFDTTLVSNDTRGPLYRVSQTDIGVMDYVQLPVMVKFNVFRKFWVLSSVQFSYAIGVGASKITQDYHSDTIGGVPNKAIDSSHSTVHLKDLPEINHFSLEIPIGIQWTISPGFNLSAIYFLGATDILNSKYHYTNTYGNTNNAFQLRLSYKLFHKKFSAE